MKTKKLIPLLALALCATTLAGCTNTDQRLTFSSYWNLSSVVADTSVHETLAYDVTFNAADGISSLIDYELSYTNGTYTTELKNEIIDGQSIYVYKTELQIDVTYTFKGESNPTPTSFRDVITTEAKFLNAANSLRPLSSTKTVVSHSPSMGTEHTSLAECYTPYEYTVTTTYHEDGSKGSCTITSDNGSDDPHDFEIDDKYTYLDNEELLFALRGIPASTSSAKAYTYNPYVERVQTVNISFSTDESDDFSFYKNQSSEKETATITYRPVSIVLNEKYPGEKQTIWYAKTTDPNNNTYRNVMLYLETPLAYSLGSLVYKLNSTSYTE